MHRGGAAVSHGDDPGQDRERDLGRRAGADVEAGRHVDPGQQLVRHAVAAQLGQHAGAALGARHQADVRQARLEAAAQRVQLVAAVRGHHQRDLVAVRVDPVAVDRHHLEAELRPSRSTAHAIGVSPTTRMAGAGSTGSRNTSIAPPDRHGFWTVTAPSSSTSVGHLGLVAEGQDPQQHGPPLCIACSE